MGFAPIDDGFLIVNNLAVIGPTLQAITLAWTTFDPELFIPFTLLSYHLDVLMHGLSPAVMHGEELVLHVGNAVLVWMLLQRWTGRGAAALLGALIFGVHPVQTEAVVWLSARKDLLMTFFALLSMLSFETFLVRSKRGWLWISAALFACAMLSKPGAALLPMVMALRMTMVHGGGWRGVHSVWPHAAIALAAITIGIIGKSHILGLQNPITSLGIATQGIVWTLGKYALLVGLRVSYDLTQPSSMTLVLCTAVTAGLLVFALRGWRRSPWMSLGIVWFIALLLPSLLNARIGGIDRLAADRYAYLPMLGVILAVIGAGEWLRLSASTRKVAAWCAGALIIICVPLSRSQTALWRSGTTLFGASLERQPSAISTRVALVRTLQQEGNIQEAFDTLKEGLRYGDDPRLHLQAGYIYAKTGDTDAAKEQFGIALAMDERSPDPHYALGALARQLGEMDAAEANLAKAISLDPSFVEAHIELAQVLIKKNRPQEAKEQLQEALRWNPSNTEAAALLSKMP